MKNRSVRGICALFLTLGLTLPAFALRQTELSETEAGLEEMKAALTPAQAGVEQRVQIYRRRTKNWMKEEEHEVSQLTPELLATFDGVRLKGLKLKGGKLPLPGQTDLFPGPKNSPVEVDFENGKITQVRVLRPDKKTVRHETLYGRVEQMADGLLLESFRVPPSRKQLAKLGRVTLKGPDLRLGKNGKLPISGIADRFTGYGAARVEMDLENGYLLGVRIFDDAGQLQKRETYLRLERTEDKKFLGTSRPQKITQARLTLLGRVTVQGVRLGKDGSLHLAGDRGRIEQHPEAPVEVDLEDGHVAAVRVLRPEDSSVKETVVFTRIERLQDGRLLHTFHDRPPSRWEDYGSSVIPGFRLTRNALQHWKGEPGRQLGRAYAVHPNAWADLFIEDGGVSWVKIVKDTKGQPVDFRTGPGMGRVNRGLYPREEELRLRLAREFRGAGVPELWAEPAAETLLRMGAASLSKLHKDGLLTDADLQTLRELDAGKTDLAALAGRVGTRIAQYGERTGDEGIVKKLVTHQLFPWSEIERLQRTYELGQTLDLIGEALNHPNVEDWIKRAQSARNRRGKLAIAKHLRRYDPEISPKFKDQGEALIVELQKYLLILDQILSSPEGELCDCVVENIDRSGDIGVRLQGELERMPELEPRQQVRISFAKGAETVWKVVAYDPENFWVTLAPADPENRSPVRRGQQARFQPIRKDIPLKQQREILARLLAQLQESKGRTTGSRVMDRLFGLIPLTADPNKPLSQEQFIDKEILADQAQEMAVQLALNKTEMTLIEGPPGTGKTKVIAEIIRQAVARGKKVLLVSQMHQAVDNALEEIMEDPAIPVLRLGNDPAAFRYGTEKFWPGTAFTHSPSAPEAIRQAASQVWEEFEEKKSRSQGGMVIAATDSGIGTDWFRMKYLSGPLNKFDLVIMDESSRETVPGALVPLELLAPDGKMVFVGDAKQLPPYFSLTSEQRAQFRAADVPGPAIRAYQRSIIEWLFSNGQGDRVMLSTNYRSPPVLARLISLLFYDGDLNTRGWEDFDAETFNLRLIDLAEEPNRFYEDRDKETGSILNEKSAGQVLEMVHFYHEQRKVFLDEITIITPYRRQAAHLIGLLKEAYPHHKNLPRVTTVDSYQGGENKVIILDFVRSNPEGEIGFLKDLRRLNVALSRALESLAIVWDSRTFAPDLMMSGSPEDQRAREKLRDLRDYYRNEVAVFFPEARAVNGNGNGKTAAGMEEELERIVGQTIQILKGQRDIRTYNPPVRLSRWLAYHPQEEIPSVDALAQAVMAGIHYKPPWYGRFIYRAYHRDTQRLIHNEATEILPLLATRASSRAKLPVEETVQQSLQHLRSEPWWAYSTLEALVPDPRFEAAISAEAGELLQWAKDQKSEDSENLLAQMIPRKAYYPALAAMVPVLVQMAIEGPEPSVRQSGRNLLRAMIRAEHHRFYPELAVQVPGLLQRISRTVGNVPYEAARQFYWQGVNDRPEGQQASDPAVEEFLDTRWLIQELVAGIPRIEQSLEFRSVLLAGIPDIFESFVHDKHFVLGQELGNPSVFQDLLNRLAVLDDQEIQSALQVETGKLADRMAQEGFPEEDYLAVRSFSRVMIRDPQLSRFWVAQVPKLASWSTSPKLYGVSEFYLTEMLKFSRRRFAETLVQQIPILLEALFISDPQLKEHENVRIAEASENLLTQITEARLLPGSVVLQVLARYATTTEPQHGAKLLLALRRNGYLSERAYRWVVGKLFVPRLLREMESYGRPFAESAETLPPLEGVTVVEPYQIFISQSQDDIQPLSIEEAASYYYAPAFFVRGKERKKFLLYGPGLAAWHADSSSRTYVGISPDGKQMFYMTPWGEMLALRSTPTSYDITSENRRLIDHFLGIMGQEEYFHNPHRLELWERILPFIDEVLQIPLQTPFDQVWTDTPEIMPVEMLTQLADAGIDSEDEIKEFVRLAVDKFLLESHRRDAWVGRILITHAVYFWITRPVPFSLSGNLGYIHLHEYVIQERRDQILGHHADILLADSDTATVQLVVTQNAAALPGLRLTSAGLWDIQVSSVWQMLADLEAMTVSRDPGISLRLLEQLRQGNLRIYKNGQQLLEQHYGDALSSGDVLVIKAVSEISAGMEEIVWQNLTPVVISAGLEAAHPELEVFRRAEGFPALFAGGEETPAEVASRAVIAWPGSTNLIFAGTKQEARRFIPILQEAGFEVRTPAPGNLILEILRAAGLEGRMLERAGEILGAETTFAGQA